MPFHRMVPRGRERHRREANVAREPERTSQRRYRKRLRSIAFTSRFRIVIEQAFRYAVSVFAEDTFTFNAVDVARSFVIAGLNAGKHVFAVHHVRLAVHDRATEKSRRQQIARKYVTAGTDFGCAVSSRIGV